ncbi:MAG TPA: TetR/AcrR family transcriptional regulator [Methylomirabilota bacterium]|nr:TetR/AcrR family transcriptional regulator [Methylomirabilota bacterium]
MSPDTRSLILREAEFLIRTRGYAAFSYADLSARVGITKASIHHHFPTKEDLIVVLVREYIERFVAVLAGIKQQFAGPGARLRAYANLFLDGFEKGMLPLCGALSAERSALPESMRPTVEDFFRIHLDWLRGVLGEGLAEGVLRPGLTIEQAALLLLSTLEGGTFVGWALAQKAPVLAAFEAALHNIEIHPHRN